MPSQRCTRMRDLRNHVIDTRIIGTALANQVGHQGGLQMKRVFTAWTAAALLTGFSAVPAFAHHPFAAEYDADKPVTVTGTIAQVNWTNPHVHVFIDGKDATGETKHWDIE